MAQTFSEWITDPFHGFTYRHATLDNGRASLTEFKDGRRTIRTIHPYDLTEYHYATSQDGDHWLLWDGGDRLAGRILSQADEVITVLRKLDAKLNARIDHS